MSEETTEIKLMRHLKGQPEPPKRPAPKGAGRKKKVVKFKKEEVKPENFRFVRGDWMTSSEISLALQVMSTDMVCYYAQRGRMPFPMVKIGRFWYARKEEVEKYIRSLYDAATTKTPEPEGTPGNDA